LFICYQHFGGCTGYGHDEAGGRGALDQVFAEIVGAESAIVRSQVLSFPFCSFLHYLLVLTEDEPWHNNKAIALYVLDIMSSNSRNADKIAGIYPF